MRCLALVLVLSAQCLSQRLTAVGYGGAGSDASNGVAIDAAGNMYVAGTTGSFDLPLANAAQASNRGTRLIVSHDSGITWQPIGNPGNDVTANGNIWPLAVDPTDPATFYTNSTSAIYKTTNGGKTFTAVTLPLTSQSSIVNLVIDPSAPKIIYAATGLGIFKSIDGGAIWAASNVGLPTPAYISSLTIDPFHPKTLWAWVGTGGYVSNDGAATWRPGTEAGASASGGGIGFIFDAVTPGILYGPTFSSSRFTYQRSTDGGVTWTPLTLPFNGLSITADPQRAGVLYAVSAPFGGTTAALYFFRSRDFGTTWDRFPFPSNFVTRVAADPANPNVLLAGPLRSVDGGVTWTRSSASRSITAAFAPAAKGLVYASAVPSTDTFLVKYAPDGKTIQFATYFGGMGDDNGTSTAVDSAGNVWIAGKTASADLPVTAGAVQTALSGDSDMFLARFNADGQLTYCTYIGGSSDDAARSIAIDARGNVWLIGTTRSTDFPTTTGVTLPVNPNTIPDRVVVLKLDASGSKLAFAGYIGGSYLEYPGSIAVDNDGNAVLTGTTYSTDFPVVGKAVLAATPPSTYAQKIFVVKLDSSGNTLFSTYLGGSKPSVAHDTTASYTQFGVALATDAAGDIFVAGNTSMVDYPVTAAAYQTKFGNGCPYPSASIYTGFIGSITRYQEDDVFLTKLSPDGATYLYSTFLGGRCYDRPSSLAIGSDGSAYIAGESDSDDFPILGAVDGGPSAQGYKSFVSAIDPSGAQLKFSSFLSAGSNPMVAAGPGSLLRVAGNAGFLAQSQQFVGGLFGPQYPNTDVLVFSINIAAPLPALYLGGVFNGFSYQAGSVAPSEIVMLSVPNLPADAQGDVGLAGLAQLTTTLAGVQVLFDGRAVPVMSVGNGRIYAIAPTDLKPSTVTFVRVRVNDAESNDLAVQVAQASPGLLSANGSGTGAANAINADGSTNSQQNPALRGSTVTFFFTGIAPGTTNVDTGRGTSAVLPLSGFVPGIYSAQVTVPSETISPLLSINVVSGGAAGQSLFIYVK